jgi:hypothetical protein
MKSLFTNGGTIKDVVVHMMHIMRFLISFMFFVFALYHFEHIYLICGKIGHIIFGHVHSNCSWPNWVFKYAIISFGL